MNEQTTEQLPDSPVEKFKLATAIILVIAGIAGYYILGDRNAGVRWGVMVAGLVAGIAMLAVSSVGRRFWSFVQDSRIELRKVVWPSKQETLQTTAVVFGFVALAGLFFWVLDLVLTWATNHLTGQGG
jgi:preprotein translocase subunit SecE